MTRTEAVAQIEEANAALSSAATAADARDAIKRKTAAVKALAQINRMPILHYRPER